MQEPYRSAFVELLKAHAASQDIHDAGDHQTDEPPDRAVSEAFIERELERVELHRRSLIPLLAPVGSVARVLDFGCGTGGTTVALATALGAERVVGVDASPSAIAAARLRSAAHGLADIVELHTVAPGRLPFGDGEFDLAVAVSVLEFITRPEGRRATVRELARVVRPGGFLFIATPRPWLREYHSGLWLGDQWHRAGRPWSSSRRQLRNWLKGWSAVWLGNELGAMAAARLGALSGLPVVSAALPHLTRWHKLLLQRPRATAPSDSAWPAAAPPGL